MSRSKYIVITPVRNEENYIGMTIESMISQKVRPAEWIIVDDGSTDRTPNIVQKFSKHVDWIRLVKNRDRGYREYYIGVMEAFFCGFNNIGIDDWDFVVKFDGDLSFGNDYFQKCFEKFEADPSLGIGGGTIYNLIKGKWVREKHRVTHVRGATKIYRRECWNQFGGLKVIPGWDTVDEAGANMHGWSTRTFDDIPIYHHRYTGTAEGLWKSYVYHGLANYISGYHPAFMAAKCLGRLFSGHHIIAFGGLAKGYLSGVIKKDLVMDDPELIKFIRQEQIRRLTFRTSTWK